jgi:hypothetical protein
MPMLLRSAVALVAVVLLAGCTGGADAEAGVAQPVPASAVPERPAGRVLTAAQARAAVPPLALLPVGWTTDAGRRLPSPADTSATVEPARCQPLFDQLYRQRDSSDRVLATSATGQYRGSGTGPYLSVTVESYEDGAAAELFDRAGRALADCPRFGSASGRLEFTASPLSFPRLGDETLTLRFLGTAGGRPFALDFVAVRMGHNSVTAQQVSLDGTADPEVLRRVATAAVGQLPGG